MEQKLTLTQVTRYTTDKIGKPLVNKNGKPYESIRIKAQEHGDKMLSGFGGAWNKDWKAGDTVTVHVAESDKLDKDSQPYLNFSKIDKEAELEGRIQLLETYIKLTIVSSLKNLDGRLKKLEPEQMKETDPNYPEPGSEGVPNPEDIPF